MLCAACRHINRPNAKFCEECGAPQATAPSPSAAVPAPDPRAYTPRHLAERILTSRAAVQGERKAVTVLFADVQGSMALAEQVDAEEWHAIMNQFFAILADGVHRFEGTVNQYTGDGIMALFGAPLAHEDHAQRACYGALHLTATLRDYAQALRRERGLQFSVRMGLNSGEVVVGAIGDDLRMDYTAQGHTVGLASRMEQLCEPGRAYLTDATAALVAGYFELEDLGLFTIKGVSAPLRVYALLGEGRLRTRLDLARSRGLSRFIGRGDELAQLETACARDASGHGRPVAIVAEAGVGKSRLSAEFADRCRIRGAAVVETQALSHGAALPYLPVLTLLRRLFGIDERDAPDVARQKIAGSLLLLDDGFKASLPLLFDFLGVPDAAHRTVADDPEARLRLLVDACVALLHARATSQPTLLVIEDLHWLDAPSDAFLRQLLAALAGAPVLPLLNYRPEYADGWLHGVGARRIVLQPLNEAAVGELLAELLGADVSLGDLAARLAARAGGNPFFVEELVQSLAQNGALAGVKGAYRLTRPVDDAAMPTSVQAVLSARIDRLAARDKDVLQTAAVIGKEFAEPVLRSVSGLAEQELHTVLRALAAAELVFEQTAFPVREYAFKHPLTQEVAYGTQLAARRSRLHAAVAAALDPRTDEPTVERAALIAYHWEHAGAVWEAAQWQRRAARALTGSDTREAVARLRRVLELLGDAPESAAATRLVIQVHDDLLRFGRMGGITRADAERLFATARALAERSDNRALLTRLLATFGESQFFAGGGADALSYLREANALARDVDDATVRLSVTLDNAQTAFWGGRLREALAYTERGLLLLQHGYASENEVPVGLWGEAFVLAQRGITLSFMGRRREGSADLERAVRLADESGSLEARSVARQYCCMAALVAGDSRRAVPLAHAAMELAVRAGNPFIEQLAQASLGAAYAMSGRASEGVALLAALTDDDGQAAAMGAIEWLILPTLADAQRTGGDPARACTTATRAIELARGNQALTAECAAQLALAAALVDMQGAAAQAAVEAALARADALIIESAAELMRPRLHAVRAQLARALGDRQTARVELRAAEERCR
jgi:class 3 adenylate cyclase/tetratricopeptide (TPR) repeat protein